jgi:hypothetical protein
VSKRDRRARKKSRRERGRAAQTAPVSMLDADLGAPEWAHVARPHLELVCRTLDHLVGVRNAVLTDLAEHLTERHRELLSLPLDRTSAAASRLLAEPTEGAR